MLVKVISRIMAIMMIWGVLSWLEISCKNLDRNPQYSDYNLIINVVEYLDK